MKKLFTSLGILAFLLVAVSAMSLKPNDGAIPPFLDIGSLQSVLIQQ